MATIDEEIVIDRPRDEVWAFASQPSNVPLYSGNIIEYEQETPGEREKGTRDRGKVKVAGRSFEFVQEIIERVEGETVTWRSLEAPMGMSWELTQTLSDAGEGKTRVRFHQEATLGGFFGKLGDGLVTKMYSRDIRANLDNLKLLIESGGE